MIASKLAPTKNETRVGGASTNAPPSPTVGASLLAIRTRSGAMIASKLAPTKNETRVGGASTNAPSYLDRRSQLAGDPYRLGEEPDT